MRRQFLLAPTLALVACAPAAPVAGPGPAGDAGLATCAAAVAAHVGKPVGAVDATWSERSPAGGGIVAVTDAAAGGGERLHTCEVDGAGTVRAILHPGA